MLNFEREEQHAAVRGRPTNPPILFVDDEQNVLEGIRRQLRKEFALDIAVGPEEGLAKLRAGEDYAIVVSDMRMPGMDGVDFLGHAQRLAPDAVRMMLTGNSDQQTATAAVNQGRIFRFLNKPCSHEMLVASLRDGLRQYELIRAEKDLLENTLTGSIEALVDILALTNPAAFCRAERIKYFVVQCAEILSLPDRWRLSVSAMLSHIGFVTIPSEILEKTLAGEPLSEPEQKMFSEHSKEAIQVLGKIPRMETVSQMIALKERVDGQDPAGDPIVLGAQLLKAVSDYDTRLARGFSSGAALQKMGECRGAYNPDVLGALKQVPPPALEKTIDLVAINELRLGMVLAEDIRGANGAMIVGKGQSVNAMMRRRLENFLQQKIISEHVRVYKEHILF